jgi:electron transfer flavoprotein alpha subunit
MTTLLLAEHDNENISDATARALTAALRIGASVDVLVAGYQCEAAARSAAALSGVNRVLLCDDPAYGRFLSEPVAALVVQISADYDNFAAPGTAFGKSVMPRVAAKLDVMQVSDIIEVVSEKAFVRPIYAGNALQTVEVTSGKRVVTVRVSAFDATDANGHASIERISAGPNAERTRFLKEEIKKFDRPELTAARVVISGGRGLGSAENFTKLIDPIAKKLEAGIGASRAAVDAGFAPNDCQVGQTGKVVAPDIYVAVGISGAIQHLAGMKDSKVIIAINKDEEAPIFQIADYGLVGDLFQILPELDRALGESASKKNEV